MYQVLGLVSWEFLEVGLGKQDPIRKGWELPTDFEEGASKRSICKSFMTNGPEFNIRPPSRISEAQKWGRLGRGVRVSEKTFNSRPAGTEKG